MAFSTDQQTLTDLRILDTYGADSVFGLFNRCLTRGGAAELEAMFLHPLNHPSLIHQRIGIIRYFMQQNSRFPVTGGHFDAIAPYLANHDERTRLSAQPGSPGRKLSNLIASDAETAAIHKGIYALVALLREITDFLAGAHDAAYSKEQKAMQAILDIPGLALVVQQNRKAKLSGEALAAYDSLFRFKYRDEIEALIRHIYLLDAYIAVARVAAERRFVFPEVVPAGNELVALEAVFHPLLKNAVPNSVHITEQNHVLFLTGANMAGKSTFMKTLSTALYLAHMGFPVPAAQMRFQVLDGLYTTINLPDNLGIGASHFYAEVLRLKKIAQEVSRGKKLFILFDELFRGTNVKDAYEATVAITTAFAQRNTGIFVLSTHIIEAGQVLQETCSGIAFLYLPTTMNGLQPVYTYTLAQGITADRHGMIIINNEKIPEMLEQGLAGTSTVTPLAER